MGSLENTSSGRLKSSDPCKTVFTEESLSRQVATIKSRLKTEIGAWLDSQSMQLTKVGKEILEEVDKGCRDGRTDIKFIPKRLVGVGYLCYGSIIPSNLHLLLSSDIGDIRVGATVVVRVEGPVRQVRDHLEIRSVCSSQPDKTVTCQQEVGDSCLSSSLGTGTESSLQYSMTLSSEGQYTVTATLYKQHITGSPLVLPVLGNPGKVLGDLELRIGDSKTGVVLATKVAQSTPRWLIGNDCLARRVEDGKWYNARVERIIKRLSSIEYIVTFTDYGDSEKVGEDGLVVSVDEIPAAERDLLDVNVINSVSSRMETITHGLISTEKISIVERSWTNKEDTNNNATNPAFFVKGVNVLVRRDQGENWSKAIIHKIADPGSLYIVKYEDNGQFDGVHPANILLDTEGVTDKHMGDVVKEEINVWVVGDRCIAKWLNNNVWYNAEVLSVGRGSCAVRFVDYGNKDCVKTEDMVKSTADIPPGSLVDKNIKPGMDENPENETVKSTTFPVDAEAGGKHATKPPRPLKPGSREQAKTLSRVGTTVPPSCPDVSSASTVPPSLQCCLCGNLCRKGMRVACSSTAVCWGCAVKKITSTHVCWQCGQPNITTDSHLVRDQVLRSFVEQFVRTGKLDPAHEQALKNGQVQSGTQVYKSEPSKVEQLQPRVKIEDSGVMLNVTSSIDRAMLNKSCVAKFSEDGIWYNGVVMEIYGDESALVYFTDYGNSERVKGDDILRGPADVPRGEDVDSHVHGGATVGREENLQARVGKFSFFESPRESPLNAKATLTINNVEGPMGVTILSDRSLAVVCRGANNVCRYSQDGKLLEVLKPGRELVKPSDILTLSSGELVVRDDRGIQLFGSDLQFIKFVAEEWIDRCFGLAEDDEGRIITINQKPSSCGSVVKITAANNTDVFFIDKMTNKVVKRIEMVDLIVDAVELLGNLEPDISACRFLTYRNNKLYVVDYGLDCVFILNKDGTESELFGSRGHEGGEFRDPTGLLVDDYGTMMVADSRNHRLQLIDNSLVFAGLVKVDVPLVRPSGLYLDQENMEIIVSNYQGKSVVRYKIDM